MRRIALFVAFVVLVVLALAIEAPPSVVAPALADATGGTVRLVDTEGSVWRGRGTVAISGSRIPIAWTTDARALAGGRLLVRLEPAEPAMPEGAFALTGNGIEVSGLELSSAAQAVAPFVPLKDLALGGDIRLSAPRIARRGNLLEGELALDWQRARILPPGQAGIDLGRVTLRLSARGEELAGPVVNDGGALALAGDVVVGLRRGISGSMLATPRRADDRELVRVLSAIGRPEQGGWRIDIRAKGS